MNHFSVCLTLLILGSAAPTAVAQGNEDSDQSQQNTALINLDSPVLLERRQIVSRLDMRAFGGKEDLLYTGLGFHLGLGHHWEGAIRAAFADRKNLSLPGGNAIRHGGTDVEIIARHRFLQGNTAGSPTVTGLIGIGLPSTPDRGSASVTLGLSASTSLRRGVVFTLNPRSVLLEA